MDQAEGGLLLRRSHLGFGHHTGETAGDGIDPPTDRRVAHIDERDVKSRHRGDLGNAAAHGAGTDHTKSVDRHEP